MHTEHSTLRYLRAKKDVNPRLIIWVLLLQEFDFEVNDRKGAGKHLANHLSRLENEAMRELEERLKLMMHSQINI